MKQPLCPYCGQDQHVIKSGLNRTGSQRYRCQQCRRYFTPDPKPEGYDLALRKQALQLYLEGTSLRAIPRCANYPRKADRPFRWDHRSR